MMDSIVTGLPHVRSGALKGIAVSTAKRTPLAPDIPTVAESGIAGFEAFLWYGIVAPAQTPPDIVAQLAREIAAVMALPDIRERMVALGSEPADSNPSTFAAFIKGEAEKWGEIVRSSGSKAD
jgi:tripartite-type tricarboxylate transporter receptor subunit TctC